MIFKTEEATRKFAQEFTKTLNKNDILLLKGDVGTGKTFFCREIIRYLAKDQNLEVTSPTFSLLQIYELKDLVIYHFDLYRLKNIEETIEIGLDDSINKGLCLIEWPEIILPFSMPHIMITFQLISDDERTCKIEDLRLN